MVGCVYSLGLGNACAVVLELDAHLGLPVDNSISISHKPKLIEVKHRLQHLLIGQKISHRHHHVHRVHTLHRLEHAFPLSRRQLVLECAVGFLY